MVSLEWKADPERMLCMPSDLLKKLPEKTGKGIRKAKQEKGRSHGGMSSSKVPVKVAFGFSLFPQGMSEYKSHLRIHPNLRLGSRWSLSCTLVTGKNCSWVLPALCKSGWNGSSAWGQLSKNKQVRAPVLDIKEHRELEDVDKAPAVFTTVPHVGLALTHLAEDCISNWVPQMSLASQSYLWKI